jgi:hypothetical protein
MMPSADALRQGVEADDRLLLLFGDSRGRPHPAKDQPGASLLMRNGKGVARQLLAGNCRLSGDSCGRPELPRRDADEALEVAAEVALVREAGGQGDLGQGEVRSCLQELPGPLDAAADDVLVRRQAGGSLELPREVAGAEVGDRGDLLQCQAGRDVAANTPFGS